MKALYPQDLFPSVLSATRTSPDSPPAVSAEFICETFTLRAHDELPYIFELLQGQQLEFEIAANRPIDLAVCEEAEYQGWVDSGFDPRHTVAVYAEAEEVVRHRIRFTAPRKDVYLVLLMNWGEEDTDIAVKATDQPIN